MKIYDDMTQLIGKTPLIRLTNYMSRHNIDTNILVKLEYYNPSGSIKARVAYGMIEDAERTGALKKGGAIIEPTSGNTGIGLAAIAASKGYRAILTMPDTMSVERRNMLKAYGAEIVLTDGSKGMAGAVEKAEELLKEIPGSFMPNQFSNGVNSKTHEETTGPEIWNDTDGKVDCFVAGVGTGGTISGIGAYLKDKNTNIKIVAVEPAGSPLLSKGQAGAHNIQGIGANFIPDVLNRDIYDDIICVTTDEAFETCREIATTEGILLGISSGAAIFAATNLARELNDGSKNIVVIAPDSGEKYMSMNLFV